MGGRFWVLGRRPDALSGRPSGAEPVQVAREQRDLPDVGRSGDRAVQRSSPIANPPCGGMPCSNDLEVPGERRRVQSARGQGR